MQFVWHFAEQLLSKTQKSKVEKHIYVNHKLSTVNAKWIMFNKRDKHFSFQKAKSKRNVRNGAKYIPAQSVQTPHKKIGNNCKR